MPGIKRLLNKRFFLTVVILLLLLSASAYFYTVSSPSPDDHSIAIAAVEQLLSADSFSFRTTSTLFVDDEERIFSAVSGQKAGDARHISGSILGSAVDIYYADKKLYRKDELSGNWLVFAQEDLAEGVILMAELDPTMDYRFNDYGDISYLGREKCDGIACYVYQLSPALTDRWIDQYFTSLTYKLKVSKKDHQLMESTICAVSRDNPNSSLMINTLFSDYNSDLIINIPQISN